MSDINFSHSMDKELELPSFKEHKIHIHTTETSYISKQKQSSSSHIKDVHNGLHFLCNLCADTFKCITTC